MQILYTDKNIKKDKVVKAYSDIGILHYSVVVLSSVPFTLTSLPPMVKRLEIGVIPHK